MRGLIRDCVLELLDRKALWIYGAVTLIAILFSVISRSGSLTIDINGTASSGMPDMLSTLIVRGFETYLSFLVFLTVMATAGLVPNMLVRGRADYFLSKPLSRVALLGGKISSIWLIYGGLIVLCGILDFVVIYLSFDWLDPRTIYLFVFALISLFVWLSITSFAAIAFNSGSLAIMTAFIFWVAQKLLQYHDSFGQLFNSKILSWAITALYYIMPKTGEMSDMSIKLASGEPVGSWQPLLTSIAFAVVAYIATLQLFKRANY